jgi:hypothetical protein
METSWFESVVKEYSFVVEILLIMLIFYGTIKLVFYFYNRFITIITFVLKYSIALILAILLFYVVKHYFGLSTGLNSDVSNSAASSFQKFLKQSSKFFGSILNSEIGLQLTSSVTETFNYVYINIFEFLTQAEE